MILGLSMIDALVGDRRKPRPESEGRTGRKLRHWPVLRFDRVSGYDGRDRNEDR